MAYDVYEYDHEGNEVCFQKNVSLKVARETVQSLMDTNKIHIMKEKGYQIDEWVIRGDGKYMEGRFVGISDDADLHTISLFKIAYTTHSEVAEPGG